MQKARAPVHVDRRVLQATTGDALAIGKVAVREFENCNFVEGVKVTELFFSLGVVRDVCESRYPNSRKLNTMCVELAYEYAECMEFLKFNTNSYAMTAYKTFRRFGYYDNCYDI